MREKLTNIIEGLVKEEKFSGSEGYIPVENEDGEVI